jgi:MFS family permease
MGMFASRWWIVAACACGLLVGAGSILIFTFGVFLKPVIEDLGISRGALSSGLGISARFVALSCPIVGWLIDRFGARSREICISCGPACAPAGNATVNFGNPS